MKLGLATALSAGILFPLIDPGAELSVVMLSRAMTPAEQAKFHTQPASWRRRKQGTT